MWGSNMLLDSRLPLFLKGDTMEKIFYVDTKEIVAVPKSGEQFVVWFTGSSQNNPGGKVHIDVINGAPVQLRAFDRSELEKFVRIAYSRAGYLKIEPVFEDIGSDK
jgi:hypothetical protein